MNFASAVKTINSLLETIQPSTFNSSWILRNAPQVYRFAQKNIRTEIGGIDWDRITRALDRKVQRRWVASHRGRRSEFCCDKRAVEIILKKYQNKLYTFLSAADKQEREVRDIISIALVRIAQSGNPDAKEELIRLLRFTVDE